VPTGLTTVEQFRRLPDDGRAYELHHGEVQAEARPKRSMAGFGQVGMELPYRPAEFDLRVADVAAVSQERYDSIDPDDNLHGLRNSLSRSSRRPTPIGNCGNWLRSRWRTALLSAGSWTWLKPLLR
jgi:hypothetical protein